MNREAIEAQVRAIMAKWLGSTVGYEIGENTDLSRLGVDSIALLCVLADIERAFDVAIVDEFVFQRHFATLYSIVDYIQVLTQEGS